MEKIIKDPAHVKGLLDPVERISEVLFGLIMALTFTCTISVVDADRAGLREMLVGAIGCNIAWGLVDAVMYILSGLAYRGRGTRIISFIKENKDPAKARAYIGETLPPVLSSALQEEDLELLRQRLKSVPEHTIKVAPGWQDFKTAIGVFLLVFTSTFPVALPFVLIDDVKIALRTSNLVAIILMFLSGWLLAIFGGYNKAAMALSLTVLGVALVLLTIALGG
jgi:hypothetical protein